LQVEADDWRDVDAGLDGTAAVEAARSRLDSFIVCLEKLAEGGLSIQESYILLVNYVNGAVTYMQRAQSADPLAWRTFDDKLADTVGKWLGTPLSAISREVLFMQAKLGGGGMAAAEFRADAVSQLPGHKWRPRCTSRRASVPQSSRKRQRQHCTQPSAELGIALLPQVAPAA